MSFVNLDLGLPLCFYDGMDDADKAGLQFVFPAYMYLLILTMTVIVLGFQNMYDRAREKII